MNKKTEISFSPLVYKVLEGIQNVKGRHIKVMDLTGIENSVTNYFVVCEGGTNTQVKAICDAIEKNVRETGREKPWHIEGKENAEWVLMDYVDVVVHIFQPAPRKFYDIESLWGDAATHEIED